MIKATIHLFSDMFKFRGKLTWPEFWFGYLGYVILVIIFAAIMLVTGLSEVDTPSVVTISVLIMAIMKYAVLVSGAKRINDAGYPWYLIFLYLFPIIGQIGVIILLCQPTSEITLSK